LIEVDERFDLQVEKTDNYLTEAGLTMVAKRHSEMFDGGPWASSFNQIWTR